MNKGEIEKEIKRLESETDKTLKNVCGITTLIKMMFPKEQRTVSGKILSPRRPFLYDYNENLCFALTEDDLQAIFDSRMKKYNELKEKLKEASNDEAIHRCGDCVFIDTDCKGYVDEDETFSEVGGCERFKRKEKNL